MQNQKFEKGISKSGGFLSCKIIHMGKELSFVCE